MSIMPPVLAMITVTLVVWVYMYAVRLYYIQTNKLNPQDMRTPELLEQTLPEWVMNPANNFKNMFEVPVLFYAVCFVIELQKLNELSVMGISVSTLAWVYVVLRLCHSLVQCTYNTVMHRFSLYMVSCIVLVMMLVAVLQNTVFNVA